MKQFLRSRSLLLISILFTFALVQLGCGSHGGNTPASSNGGNTGGSGGGSQAGPTLAAFSLKLVDKDQALHAGPISMKTSTFGTPPVPDWVRVVIRTFGSTTEIQTQCSFDDQGFPINCVDVPVQVYTETYRDIQDVPYSTVSVTVGIPAGNGYQLDVITSKITTTNKVDTYNILSYGTVTGVDISSAPSGTTNATVIMTHLYDILNMTVADSVTSNQDFTVTLNDALPVWSSYQIMMSFGTGTPTIQSNGTNTCTFTAPVSFVSGTVYLQGTFYLDPSFLKKNEPTTKWQRLFPLAVFNEQVYSEMNPLLVVTLPGL